MNVPQSTSTLLLQLAAWVEKVNHHHKQAAFERIKRKLLRQDLRKLGKGAFASLNSTTDNYTSVADSFFIYEFRPLEQNYTSVKIMDYETHGVKRDLRDCFAKRIDFTVAQLCTKGSFLESWMVQQAVPPLVPQNYPLSDYATKKMSGHHEQALATIRRLTFSHYCKQYLRSRTSVFGFTHRDPLSHRSTPISRSLTYLQGRSNQIALEAFEILLKAGGEVESARTYLFEINRLVELVHLASDSIKEEVFLQVIKQSSSGKLIYTRILCCLCYCVKVPTRLYVPLLNYLYEATLTESTPKQLNSYCFYHAIRNFDRERSSPPCIFELYCAYHATKVPITIKFPRQKAFFVESYTTVEELMAELIEFYNLDPNIQYLLEVSGFLMERGILLENLSRFCKVQEEDYKWKDYQRFQGLFAVIVLKNVDDATRSPDSLTIMYNYCVNQYLRGFYALTTTEVLRIAALKMHSELDDEENYNFDYENLITKRKLYGVSNARRLEYRKNILKQYYQIHHLERTQAREQIIAILSKYKGYGTHFFKCEVYQQDFEASIAWVGVQRGLFLIIEASSGRVMRTIAFHRIREWGRSSSELCLRVDSIGELHMQSPQVEVLTSVFQTYINYHMQLLY